MSAPAPPPMPRKGYYRRPVGSVSGLARESAHMLAQLGLDQLPDDEVFLYGSFVRSFWTRERWKDINIAFRSQQNIDFYSRQGQGGSRISVRLTPVDDPVALIDSFDFTICQVAYHDGAFFYADSYFEHLAQRLLVLHRINEDDPVVTLLRSYKYTARGFGMTFKQLHLLTEAIRVSGFDLEDIDLAHHSGGVILPA